MTRTTTSGREPSFLGLLADETVDWMLERPRGEREDISDEVWAFALATFVDGTAITPQGYDETHKFEQ